MKRIVKCCTNCKYLKLSDKKEPCNTCYDYKKNIRRNFTAK